MDAGVPIKAAVAGIAMGLVKEEDKFVVLSRIFSVMSDHLVIWTSKLPVLAQWVTALQMDMIEGITPEIGADCA